MEQKAVWMQQDFGFVVLRFVRFYRLAMWMDIVEFLWLVFELRESKRLS